MDTYSYVDPRYSIHGPLLSFLLHDTGKATLIDRATVERSRLVQAHHSANKETCGKDQSRMIPFSYTIASTAAPTGLLLREGLWIRSHKADHAIRVHHALRDQM